MSNVYDIFEDGAVARGVSSTEDEPEKAARALELEKTTGVSSELIHDDLDNFEDHAKAATAAHLIRGNKTIQDYINSHPLAAKVSNGDLHNLDEATKALKQLPKTDKAWSGALGGAAGTLGWQFGSDFVQSVVDTAKTAAKIPGDIGKYEMPGSQIKPAIDRLNREGTNFHTVAGLMAATQNTATEYMAQGPKPSKSVPYNVAIKDAIDTAFGTIGTLTGVVPAVRGGARIIEQATTVPAEFTEQVAMLGMMFFGLKGAKGKGKPEPSGRPFVEGGEIPPPGLSEEADAIRAKRSEEGRKTLKDATQAVQKTQTSKLSPDMARNLVEQVTGDRSVFVNASAVRKLYGDKVPAPDDGILGWVKDLSDQLEAAEPSGGDIAIPIKDWVTRVDPEVADLLHDNLKVREDDITKAEEDFRKEAGEARDKGLVGVDLTRRGFLKGLGATAASAATDVKLPKLEEANPFAGADLSMFDANVKDRIADYWEWFDMINGGPAGKDLIGGVKDNVLRHLRSELQLTEYDQAIGNDPRFDPRFLEAMIKTVESGYVPPKEVIEDIRNEREAQVKGDQESVKETKRKPPVEEPGVRPFHVEEQYMKEGYPSGLIEWSPRNVLGRWDEAVDSVRKAARLKALVPAEGRKPLRLESLGANARGEFTGPDGTVHKGDVVHDVRVREDDGRHIMDLAAAEEDGGKKLYIDNMQNASAEPWQEGIAQPFMNLRVAEALFNHFPEADIIEGMHVSGSGKEAPKRISITRAQLKEILGAKKGIEGKRAEPRLKLGSSRVFTTQTSKENQIYKAESVGSIRVKDAFAQLNLLNDKWVQGPLTGIMHDIVQKLTDKIGHKAVHFVKDDEFNILVNNRPWYGFYDVIHDEMILPESGLYRDSLGRTILHEALHSGTMNEVFERPELKDMIEGVMNEIKSANILTDEYGMTNWKEFLAEAFSNSDFQRKLAQIQISPEMAQKLNLKPGIVKTAWDSFLSFIAKTLGIKDDHVGFTALEAAVRVTGEALDTNLSLNERLNLARERRKFDAAADQLKIDKGPRDTGIVGAISSTNQLEKIRSFSRLQDRLAEQAGDLIKGSQKEGASKFDNLRYLHNAIVNWIGLEKPGDLPPNIAELAKKLDPDDVKNYMRAYTSMDSAEFASLVEHVNEREGTKKEARADHTEDMFRAVTEAAEDLKNLAERKESPSIQPGREFLDEDKGLSGAKKRQPELPGLTRMEDRPAFETPGASGMSRESYDKIQKLINEQQTADAKARMEFLLRKLEREKSEEWKKNEEQMHKEVEAEVRARPDIAADEALRRGRLTEDAPKTGRRIRLNSDMLTEEQKAALDPSEYAEDGMNPDDFANFFGFKTAQTMFGRLEGLRSVRKNGPWATPEAHIQALVRQETGRRMQATYGDLGAQILEEARDHVVDDSQYNLLHEETIGLAQQANMEFSLTREGMKAAAKQAFAKMKASSISVERFLREAGKRGEEVQHHMLNQNWVEAFKAKQAQTWAMAYAMEAKKLKQVQDQWKRNAKLNAKRKREGIEQPYLNAVHDIMFRAGTTPRPRRTAEDLADAFRRDGRDPDNPFKSFVEDRRAADRVLAVPDFLLDSKWSKGPEDITAGELIDLNNAVKSLIHNGRNESKLFKEGEAQDKKVVYQTMRDQVENNIKLPIKRPFNPRKNLSNAGKAFWWLGINVESMLYRLDGGKYDGIFQKYLSRVYAPAFNEKDALISRFQKKVSEINVKDLNRKVENDVFVDQTTGLYKETSRREVLGALQYLGEMGALDKLAKGYKVDPQAIWDWVAKNTTKEDWDNAQQLGKIFDELFELEARMVHEQSGVAPVKVPLVEFTDPFGVKRQGWYTPLKYDPNQPGTSRKLAGPQAEAPQSIKPQTPQGHLKERSGYVAPLELALDHVPIRMNQMIHDIAIRPAIIQMDKIIFDPEFQKIILKHYGRMQLDEMKWFVHDMANPANFHSLAQESVYRSVEFLRQNMVTGLVGFNILSTTVKHGATALFNSINQVGGLAFGKELATILAKDEQTGERNWQSYIEKSEELQRRLPNFSEVISGKGSEINVRGAKGKFASLRQILMTAGARPVGWADMMSSVAAWGAKYHEALLDGKSEGDARAYADFVVRQTHGSSVWSNKPGIMRTGNPFVNILASVYGFFSHMMQKNYEILWRSTDAFREIKGSAGDLFRGQMVDGFKGIGDGLSDIPIRMMFAYWVVPAIIEELVTPYTNSEKDSWGKKLGKAVLYNAGSSMVIMRDFVHAYMFDFRDPEPGLGGTMGKTVMNVARDLQGKQNIFKGNKDKQAKFVHDMFAMIGLMTGLTTNSEGALAEYLTRLFQGTEQKPKGPWQAAVGARYGKTKGHSKTMDEYVKKTLGVK